MKILYIHVGISVGHILRDGIVRFQGAHMFHFVRYNQIHPQSGCNPPLLLNMKSEKARVVLTF